MHVCRRSKSNDHTSSIPAIVLSLLLVISQSSCRKQKKSTDAYLEYTAALTAVNAPLAFGTAAINTDKDGTLTIQNSGQLIATGITADALGYPFRFKDGVFPGTGGTCLPILQAGATCTLVLQYAPTLGGIHSGKLSLNFLNGFDESVVKEVDIAELGGNATNGAALNISDGTTYDYGNVVVGTTSDKTFTVTNSGSLAASAIAAGTPALAAPFTWKGGTFPGTGATCTANLNVSATCTIVVRFTPTTSGVSTETVRISYSDGLQSQTATRAVTATGQSPASLGISDGPTYDYGNQYQTLTTDKTFTVTNSGGATATSVAAGTPALVAPFGFKGGSYPGTAGTCGSSVVGGANCTLVVTFSPSAAGGASDTIRVAYTNGVSSTSATRAVTATGVGYAALSVSDGATYAFGSKYITTTNTDKTFTVTNSLTGSATSVSGAALSAPFAYLGGSYPGTGATCGATILGSGSCTIIVRYSPTTLGAHSGTLTVNYTRPDASTTTATRAMSGTGIGNPGELDTTWSSDGKVSTAIGAGNERGYAVALDSSGRAVVAGYSYNGTNNDFAIARYTTSGVLDTDFSSDGLITVDVSAGGNDIAYAIAIQSDGKILVGGQAGSTGNLNFAVIRLSTSGALDDSYGAGGIMTANFNNQDDIVRAMALDSNGKLVVTGPSTSLTGNMRFAVVRFNTDGSLDTSFDTDGKATYQPVSEADNDAYAIAIQSNGKIVVAGGTVSGSYQFSVMRISSAGALDTTFDTDGYALVDVTGGTDIAKAMKIDSSGNIVLAGSNSGSTMTVVKLSSAGALDTAFDTDGIATVDIGTGADDAAALAIDSSGYIIVAGFATNTDKDFGLARLSSTGSLDATFDGDGKIATDYALGATNHNSIFGLALQSDGKIVAVGDYDTGANADLAVFRYWP